MECMEEKWDVDDVLENNTSVFVVKNITEERLIYAMSAVYHYIIQFNNYDILFYAEPSTEPKTEFFIFTNFPYDHFLEYNPEYDLDV